MALTWNFIKTGLFDCQCFIQELNMEARVESRAWNSGQEGNLTQEVGKGQLAVFQSIISNFFRLAQAFKHGKEHLFEDIVILYLCL